MPAALLSLILIGVAQPVAPCPAPTLQVEANRPRAAAGFACIAESGPNWTFLFAWPAAADRIPALRVALLGRAAVSRADFATLPPYASEHPEGRFHYDEVYDLDADRPELIALSTTFGGYQGGAHGWYGHQSLIWDRAEGREIAFLQLFSDPAGARAGIERQLCPALLAVRRRLAARRSNRIAGHCGGGLPEQAALVGGADGTIRTIRFNFAELDGYAGGEYVVHVPVTPQLIAAIEPRFRPAFGTSSARPLGCNSNLPDPACAARRGE